MTWVVERAEGATELDQVWGTRPEYYEFFVNDYVRCLKRVDPILGELVRIRIAQILESSFDFSLRSIAAISAGLTEEKIAQLSHYPTSKLFCDRERAVLEFAEQLVMQSSSITDDDCVRLQKHVTVEEFIHLVRAMNTFDQFARANSAFGIQPSVRVPALLSSEFTLADAAKAERGH